MAKNKKRSSIALNLFLREIHPLTENQHLALISPNHLILGGSAGTGKTFLALAKAFQGLSTGDYERVRIIRSVVPTRDIGFLPGTEAEKCAVYELPYKQLTQELYGRGDAYEILKSHHFIDFTSTSFVRGITLDRTCVIVDEAQNMTFHELDTIATRLGKDSTLIICGDFKQADLPNNGLREFLKILTSMKHKIDYIIFTPEDIVRDEFVKDYILTKERLEYEKSGS
jgi:phosphate starvation-inducible protein PhoH